MLNTPLISDLIFKGEVSEIKEIMKRSRELGMQTFDQSLFDLYESQTVTYEDALRNADSVNDLRLQIKLHSHRARSGDLTARHRAPAHRITGRFAHSALRWIKTASSRPLSLMTKTYETIPSRRVAFLGLGVMGYPMAGHLARAGHAVTVYHRTAAKAGQW
jgi:hypothetical protein